ncbi:MAG: DUF4169 family protein [Pseudomonadota bacterium]
MTEPINLNKRRKARAKAQARTKADANSVRFGLTKAQKSLNKASRDLVEKRLSDTKRAD